MPKPRLRLLAVLAVLSLVGVAAVAGVASCLPSHPEPQGELGAVPVSEPSRLCVGGARGQCRPVAEIRESLGAPGLALVQAAEAPGGEQGAAVLTLRTPAGLTFDVKWRAFGTASRFNDPVAEIGSDRVQQLVLAPEDAVIPPATALCLPSDAYEEHLGHERAAFPGTECVLGVVSFWLHGSIGMGEARREGIVPGEAGRADPGLFDPERFESDRRYRRNIAQLNLIAFLVSHGDAHAAQFVIYPDPVHIFLVDNSVALGIDHRSAMEDRQDLHHLLVPSIPEENAARLRELTRDQVEALRVLVELRNVDEVLVPVEPGAPFGAPDERVRHEGDRVQIGLTAEQIELLWSRVRKVRGMLDEGSLQTF